MDLTWKKIDRIFFNGKVDNWDSELRILSILREFQTELSLRVLLHIFWFQVRMIRTWRAYHSHFESKNLKQNSQRYVHSNLIHKNKNVMTVLRLNGKENGLKMAPADLQNSKNSFLSANFKLSYFCEFCFKFFDSKCIWVLKSTNCSKI